MAEIICRYDTVTKALVVTSDGDHVEFDYINFGRTPGDPEKFSMSSCVYESDPEAGTTRYTQLSAEVSQYFDVSV